MTDEEIKRPVAVISGASRGIGRAVALRLAQDGFDIAFSYHQSSQDAETLAESIRQLGARVEFCQCDIADFESVKAWMNTVEQFGTVQVLVANAGIVRDRAVVSMSPSEWSEVIGTNLNGTFNLCKSAIFGLMKRGGGSVICVSSIAGLWGNASQSNYAASKAGIIAFAKSLAKEVGSFGVRVNSIAPGPIATDMTKSLPEKSLKKYISQTPLGRMGTPEDVANLVSFLASEQAAFITGQTICVDGGINL